MFSFFILFFLLFSDFNQLVSQIIPFTVKPTFLSFFSTLNLFSTSYRRKKNELVLFKILVNLISYWNIIALMLCLVSAVQQ